jgi:hypothetical protein
MSKAIKHPSVFIMGRIPDSENEWNIYTDVTIAEAKKKFIKRIYDDSGESRSQITKMHGVSCYLEIILSSDSKITYRGGPDL